MVALRTKFPPYLGTGHSNNNTYPLAIIGSVMGLHPCLCLEDMRRIFLGLWKLFVAKRIKKEPPQVSF
jgi:hypothetical protein